MPGFFASSLVHQPAPLGSVPKCGACGLLHQCRSPKMKAHGKFKRQVLVVGEAPGETEDNHGRPFIGKAGQFLREALEGIGIDLDRDALTTNALICRPPGNKTPDDKQIAYCRPNLTNLIAKVQPRVIILLGKTALTSVMKPIWEDLGGLERWIGWCIPLRDHWVCPTYHPSFLLRSKNQVMDRMFAQHLEAAFAIDRDPPRPPKWERIIRVELDEGWVDKTLKRMAEQDTWAAVDYETNSLKPEWPEARIVSCSVGTRHGVISYPWTRRTAASTARILFHPGIRKISSNLKMEERWTLEHFGRPVENWGWDTMLATHCLDNRTGICSLKFQSLVQFGVPPYNKHIEPFLYSSHGQHINRITSIDLTQLLYYGGMDAALEYKLAMKQRKEFGHE